MLPIILVTLLLLISFYFYPFITMTTSFHHHNHHLFFLTTAILLCTLSSATTPSPLLNHACKSTRYPTTCQTTLLHHPLLSTNPNPTPYVITRAALSLSSTHLSTALSLSKTILITFPHHRNRSMAATTCLDLLTMSHHRTHITLQKLSSSREDDVTTLKDARAWVSGALTYQTDCWSELSYVNHTRVVDQAMSFLESTLIPTTSNALSMMMSLENFGHDVGRWGPPKTERDGFWERVDRSGLDGLRFEDRFSKPERANAVVCKKKITRGCHATVQKAVDGAPEGLRGKDKYVIYIKEGVYEEIVRVPLEKSNLVLLGDGMGKTVITGSVNTGILGISTYNTATVGVKGDGFMAMGITFQNTAGPNAHQAVAFRSDSDLSLVENCEFLSNQDTLYLHSLRQVYRSCRIEGNVDFIFGNGAGLFQDCSILVRPRMLDPTKGENNAITAQGRTDPAQKTGFVFLGCLINGTNEYMKLVNDNPKVHHNYLGRPWKMYSRTVFIECYMDRLVSPEGWMPFRDDFALSTLYYGEFGNKGRGADLSMRVGWSNQIRNEHVIAYSARNFVQADEWSSVL